MNKILLTMAALLGMTTAAMAETKPVVSTNVDQPGLYLGGYIGSSTLDRDRVTVGVNGGYQVNRFLRGEVTLDQAWKTGVGGGTRLMGNAIGQYRIPGTTLTPYVLAGMGYGFDSLGSVRKGIGVPQWNVGAGMRVAVSERVDLDARYRYIEAFNAKTPHNHSTNLFTVGATYKF